VIEVYTSKKIPCPWVYSTFAVVAAVGLNNETMEELADAIEDAQYVNAIATQDNGPRPVLRWDKPTADELMAWEEALVGTYNHIKNDSNNKEPTSTIASQPFSMEWCCQQPIGYFLFSQYVKEVYDDYPRLNFCEQVLRFQKCKLISARMELAAEISRDFLGYQQAPVVIVADQPPAASVAKEEGDATGDITDDELVTTTTDNLEAQTEEGPKATTEERKATAEEPPATTAQEKAPPGAAAAATPGRVNYVWPIPPRTEIMEYDLARPVLVTVPSPKPRNTTNCNTTKGSSPVSISSGMGLNGYKALTKSKISLPWSTNTKFGIAGMTAQELHALYTVNMDFPTCSESVVGVKGPILKEIIQLVQEMEAAAPQKSKSFAREEGPAPLSRQNSGTSQVHCRSGGVALQRSSSNMDKHERVAAALEALGTSTKSIRTSSLSHISTTLNITPGSTHSTRKHSSAEISVDGKIVDDDDDDSNDECRSSPTAKTKTYKGQSRSAIVLGNVIKLVPLPSDLFERAEYIAMESLRRQYWDDFVQSRYWLKLKNFLWYQDRRVIPDDFFVLRVLGRGGFGLVTGKLSQNVKVRAQFVSR
jgi:hypothetical protein